MTDFSKRLVAYWVDGIEPEVWSNLVATLHIKYGSWNETHSVNPEERAEFVAWLADNYSYDQKGRWRKVRESPGEYLERIGVTVWDVAE